MKDECIKYLESDVLSLLQVMSVFIDETFNQFLVDVTKCLTISRLGLNIFLKNDYNPTDKKCIGVVNKRKMFEHIKEGYIGGITEVYKPKGENLYLSDCNSLYPFASLGDMPGNHCVYVEDSKPIDLTNKFGFY